MKELKERIDDVYDARDAGEFDEKYLDLKLAEASPSIEEISAALFEEISKRISRNIGFEFTPRCAKALLATSPGLRFQMFRYGTLDTMARERLLEVFALKSVGMAWPLNRDSDDYKAEFEKRLEQLKGLGEEMLEVRLLGQVF